MKYVLPFFLLLTFHAAASGAALRLVERATSNIVSGSSDRAGNILTFTNDVFDAANKTKLGADQGYCVRLIAGKSWECHFTVMLAHGQLSVDGPFLDDGDTTMVVTGGSGAYRGADGEMLLHARDAKGSAYDYTIELK